MDRDPRKDPRENDVLFQTNGTLELHVDMVDGVNVYYRVTDGHGGLLGACKTPMANWVEWAPYVWAGWV